MPEPTTAPIDIKHKIMASHPKLSAYLSPLPPIEALHPAPVTVLNAVSEIVIGQMLSRKSAAAIIRRTQGLASQRGVEGIGSLSMTELKDCGISERKAKAILLFAEEYRGHPKQFEGWRTLKPVSLFREVNRHWGLSNWSAAMLAIFYFAMEDVFPYEDGTIRRVIETLSGKKIKISPPRSKPYRSYLALYLWKLLDDHLLES